MTTVDIKGANSKDELGAMARAVEVFRQSGVRVSELTEEEKAASARRRVERTQMLVELGRSFGAVVDAAVDGDFSKRVETSFSDAELNGLATSVNKLVATVERGLADTGEVLGCWRIPTLIARRMTEDYRGAFGRLQDDTNGVGIKLAEVVGRWKTPTALRAATTEILSGKRPCPAHDQTIGDDRGNVRRRSSNWPRRFRRTPVSGNGSQHQRRRQPPQR